MRQPPSDDPRFFDPALYDPTDPTPLHPALIPPEQLLRQCDLLQTRRSGPGGQHRNKVSTAIVLTHKPTAICGEASESRDQARNRQNALRRLRENLALAIRSQKPPEATEHPLETALRARYHGANFRLAESNPDRPAILALLLDDLALAQWRPPPVAPQWETSASQITRFLKTIPQAFQWLNQQRTQAGLRPLK